MCGRYTINTEDEIIEMREIIKEISIRLSKEAMAAQYGSEAYPSANAPIITQDKVLILSKWGFKKWDNKGIIFNARCERLMQSKFFAPYIHNGRCVVPASSFFEWEKQNGKPIQKYKIYSPKDKLFFMAGIFRRLADGNSEYVVITRNAAENIRFIHDRMPLIFDEELSLKWLAKDFEERLLYLDSIPIVYEKVG